MCCDFCQWGNKSIFLFYLQKLVAKRLEGRLTFPGLCHFFVAKGESLWLSLGRTTPELLDMQMLAPELTGGRELRYPLNEVLNKEGVDFWGAQEDREAVLPSQAGSGQRLPWP